jgi:uncharacterized protein
LKPFLLDVNVLLALLWPRHIHHGTAKLWFDGNSQAGIRTCPITQSGFVRILSNPRFSPDFYSVREATTLLWRFTNLPEHEFWPDDLDFSDALPTGGEMLGHQQITDAYLLALSKSRGGTLATLDRGALALPGARGFVELIS